MATYEFYIYSTTALAYNPRTNAFDFDAAYDHTQDRLRIVVNDDDATFDSTGDGNQTATVYDMNGNVVTSGLLTTPYYGELDDPASTTNIFIDHIEVNGVHIGYMSDVLLTPGTSYPYLGGSSWNGAYSYYQSNSIPCFAPVTPIATARGPVAVRDIRPGDMVETLDHGLQPVLWAGAQRVADPESCHWPVRLAGPIPGAGSPRGVLQLSAQHRVLLTDPWFDLTGTGPQVLAPACGLAAATRPAGAVTWHHLLFARHEIIRAAGLWVESLFAGGVAFTRMPPVQRIAARQALDGRTHAETARPCLRRWEAELFLAQSRAQPLPRAA